MIKFTRQHPALDVRFPSDDLAALLDDFHPTAIEEHTESWRVFFSTSDARDAALTALGAAHYAGAAVEVSDEDWARRSQERLGPITVGRITIAPPWAASQQSPVARQQSEAGGSSTLPALPAPLVVIVIEPSTGFGTGHHATTRLCLAGLQRVDLAGRTLLDVGTGSGVLAIAASRLGTSRAVGIDNDPDAVEAAHRNLALNPDARHVDFRVADLASDPLPCSDVVTANLTGALIQRTASVLSAAVKPGGVLIVSGVLAEERDEVVESLLPANLEWEYREDEWVGLILRVASL